MCLAGIDRLKRCRAAQPPNATFTGECCPYAQFTYQFCQNREEFVSTVVTPEEWAYFNATMEMCNREDGGHGGYDECASAVYNASGCYSLLAFMTGEYDKPHPECCGFWSNVQSKCGSPGDSVLTVTNLLTRVMNALDPYSFGVVANMSNYCPGA
jgi:hypothetical protein